MEQTYQQRVKRLGYIRLVLLVAALCLWAGCGGESESDAEFSKGSLLPAAESADQAADSTHSSAVSNNFTVGESLTTPIPSLQPVSAAKSDTPVNKIPQTADQKMKQTAPARSSSTATGQYTVQIGSFRSADNAHALIERVTEMGYRPEVEVASLGGQTYHRVVIKGLVSRQEAERCGEHIRSQEGITYLIRRR